ncbi:hypothetical protein O0I10_009304 [Lichtheimia ornata]|uniref:Uncharacterized protein n=1 Tax=Lichtheimia ornata TaxID=688661 RepID=A0AAD7UYM2_9FUNG|nr:uncharacterized protein O0I10_009304 [Lichtheimia ornata]KAJ8655097.1 hypothetical protein O0I10_009304 [Lichtheimia ornata]
MDTTTFRHPYHASATTAPKVHGSKYYGHGRAGPSTLLRLPRPYSNLVSAPATMLHPSVATTAATAAAASSTTMHSASAMPTFVVQLPSSAVVQSDPNFGTNSPASTTTPLANNNNSINVDQQDHNNSNNAHLIGPIVGTIGGVIVICLAAFFLLRKRKTNNHTSPSSANNQPWGYNQRQRKDSESGHSTLRENSAYHLHPPPAYTSRDAKRLTADTLVSIDQRSSLSTMVSKRQYMPQLAYSPSKASLNQRDQELGVSPSNTLIGTLSENDDDLKHNNNGRQRVPSYQPQVAIQQPEEPTITNEPPPPAGEEEIQSYYNYISQNETHSRSPTTTEPHDQKS